MPVDQDARVQYSDKHKQLVCADTTLGDAMLEVQTGEEHKQLVFAETTHADEMAEG